MARDTDDDTTMALQELWANQRKTRRRQQTERGQLQRRKKMCQLELFGGEVMRRECMDCGKCYGYTINEITQTCNGCSPDCDLYNDKEILITTGLCDECFEIRMKRFDDELSNK